MKKRRTAAVELLKITNNPITKTKLQSKNCVCTMAFKLIGGLLEGSVMLYHNEGTCQFLNVSSLFLVMQYYHCIKIMMLGC